MYTILSSEWPKLSKLKHVFMCLNFQIKLNCSWSENKLKVLKNLPVVQYFIVNITKVFTFIYYFSVQGIFYLCKKNQ